MNIGGLDFTKVIDTARKGLDKARQYAEGLNELEIKVEEATNSDKWGPHGTLMQGTAGIVKIGRHMRHIQKQNECRGAVAARSPLQIMNEDVNSNLTRLACSYPL